MASVYLGLSGDFLHHGHINILNVARSYGELTIGLLTDAAIASRKRLPLLTFEQRKVVVENLQGVQRVVAQEEWDYSPNILRHKPDFFVHGDDWLVGPEFDIRSKVVEALASYGGQLVEVPYTQGVSSGALMDASLRVGSAPQVRLASLRRQLDAKKLLRFIEAHSPLSALVAERTEVIVDGNRRTFDGFWSSSLTDSTNLGKPDTEAVPISTRLNGVNSIFEVTSLPLIFDADTGGQPEHLELHIKSMERLGISAAIIEDKTGLKKNSLLGNSVFQQQADIEEFSEKIRLAKNAQLSWEFMLIARVESLILEAGMDDALNRADAYVSAGADGVMIHSRRKEPDEVFEFTRLFREYHPNTPLVCVPTSYNQVNESELEDNGVNVVIYANHLLRASYPALRFAASQILENGRSFELDDSLASIDEILSLIPGTR